MNDSSPIDQIWRGLLDGDPGPTVAFFDSLMSSDCPYAAGGLLNDIAERIRDADEVIEDEAARDRFVATAQEAIACCMQNDQSAIEELMASGDEEE